MSYNAELRKFRFTETLKYVKMITVMFKNMDQIEGGLYMIKLYENGVYLLNGTEIVEDTGMCRFR